MENQTFPSPEFPSSQNPKPKLAILIAAGLTILAVGIGVGLAIGKYSLPTFSQISSYDDCVKAKDSIVSRSYPSVCITASGQRFTQSLTDEEKQNLQPPDPNREPTDSLPAGRQGAATAGWETYKDPEGIFTFKYPLTTIISDISGTRIQEIKLKQVSKGLLLLSVSGTSDPRQANIVIDSTLLDDNANFELAVEKIKERLPAGLRTKNFDGGITIYGSGGMGTANSGQDITVFVYKYGVGAIIVENNGNFYSIDDFDQILSTFRFME